MGQDCIYFKEFLWDSFCDGQTNRELRLSDEELTFLYQCYPEAICRAAGTHSADGKCWYAVSLSPCIAKAI